MDDYGAWSFDNRTVIRYYRSKTSLKKLRELENLVLYNTVLPVHFIGFNRRHGDKKIPLCLI